VGGGWKVSRECAESVGEVPGECTGSAGGSFFGSAELSSSTCETSRADVLKGQKTQNDTEGI
jgi:hypothetical protein